MALPYGCSLLAPLIILSAPNKMILVLETILLYGYKNDIICFVYGHLTAGMQSATLNFAGMLYSLRYQKSPFRWGAIIYA